MGAERHLDDLLSRLGVAVISTDAAGRVTSVSPLAERLTGWPEAEALGRAVDGILSLARDSAVTRPTDAGGLEQCELIARDGSRLPIEHALAPIRDAAGHITKIEIAFHDVSQRHLAELQLARQASHDPLTGLLNASAFQARLEEQIESGGTRFAVCQLDLDQFNLINNACGHSAGNRLLQWVAALLREESRPDDVLARFEGDVFCLLLRDAEIDEARRVIESILRRLRDFQFTWDDKSFAVGASIGLVIVRQPPRDAREVRSAADHACTMAKRGGRDQLWICHLEDEELARRQQEMEWIARIKKHLGSGDVVLYAQPIRAIARGKEGELAFEVLLRMNDEAGRPHSVARLIEAAERHGLMTSIDRWVIRNTLRTLASQPKAALDELAMCSINISGLSLRDTSFLEFVHTQIASSGLAPAKLCFELTETAVISDMARARWLIEELLAIGCRFALDDFGSGLASYSHLKDLPVNFLKIAGEFVENLAASPLDRAMVCSIVQISRVLGLATVAEAVSSRAAYEAVVAIGADYAQGNWIAPPAPLARLATPRRARERSLA